MKTGHEDWVHQIQRWGFLLILSLILGGILLIGASQAPANPQSSDLAAAAAVGNYEFRVPLIVNDDAAPSRRNSATPTVVRSATTKPSATRTFTAQPSATRTFTQLPSATRTFTQRPSATRTVTQAPSVTRTPTRLATATPTPTVGIEYVVLC